LGTLFGALVDGMIAILNGLYNLTAMVGVASYGLAIILLTCIVKILLYPLNYKQMQSMLAMQKIQPLLKEIQEKYKKDPQKMQQKMMEIYREQGINPMSGCLPLLIQLPIIIALYRGLLNLLKSTDPHKLHFLWINNLGESVTHLIQIHAFKPEDVIFPLLAGLATYWQMRITPSSSSGGQESMQRTMTLMMPPFVVYISTTLPSGLALYWAVYNILSIVQQYYINKRLYNYAEEVTGDNAGGH